MIRGKNILILSPQGWGELHVSKHHYALALLERNNTVYFLNPLRLGYAFRISTRREKNGLVVVEVCLPIPSALRFKFRQLYNVLIDFYSKRIRKRLAKSFDIVWCFDPNYFNNLRKFGKYVIYHPVDPVVYDYQVNTAAYADVVLSVSDEIIQPFLKAGFQAHFVNHGASAEFVRVARANLEQLTLDSKPSHPVRMGYVGNLLRSNIDWNLFLKIIEGNPDTEFHFFGPYQLNATNNLGGSQAALEVISTLRGFSNVTLHGPVPSDDVISHINPLDGFILPYKMEHGLSDRSNSHKLLEYLSTGKVVVSVDITTYRKFAGIVEMTAANADHLLPEKASEVIRNIGRFNDPVHRGKRLEFVLENSYEKQIGRIETIIKNQQNKKARGI